MAETKNVNGIDGDKLLDIVERIESFKVQAKSIAEDIKDMFSEAKSKGFDVDVLKKVLKAREKDRDERIEAETLFDAYMKAIGEE